jgi:hypothetical protein
MLVYTRVTVVAAALEGKTVSDYSYNYTNKNATPFNTFIITLVIREYKTKFNKFKAMSVM